MEKKKTEKMQWQKSYFYTKHVRTQSEHEHSEQDKLTQQAKAKTAFGFVELSLTSRSRSGGNHRPKQVRGKGPKTKC